MGGLRVGYADTVGVDVAERVCVEEGVDVGVAVAERVCVEEVVGVEVDEGVFDTDIVVLDVPVVVEEAVGVFV